MARIVKVADAANDKAKPYEVRWSWYDAEGNRQFKKARYRTRREADAKRREVEDAVAAANLPDYAGGKESVTVWGNGGSRPNARCASRLRSARMRRSGRRRSSRSSATGASAR